MQPTEQYGLLTYEEGRYKYNVGDYIQSLAARQFLPRVDALLNREKLGAYQGDPIKLIMNGWFTHNIHHWVPSEDIDPLFVSFHINSSAAPHMLSPKGIEYLKRHQPIGCRDEFSVEILKKRGIEAYFTGCLTLTLDSYKVADSERGEDIYIVDPFYNYPSWEDQTQNKKMFLKSILNGSLFNIRKRDQHLRQLVSEEVLRSATYITQVLPVGKQTDEEKFAYAEQCLKKYARAKFVITSRIHCALPCLALGTPVIFINAFDNWVDSCRFGGIMELFNRIDVKPDGSFIANFEMDGKIDLNYQIRNKLDYVTLANELKKKCKAFVNQPILRTVLP